MIFGNPNIFAIYIDLVKVWSVPSFPEGTFGYIIGNELTPDNCFNISCTLSAYWLELELRYSAIMERYKESKHLFELETIEAYKQLEHIRYQECVWTYVLHVGDMIDHSNEIYLVTYKDKERLIFKPKHTETIKNYVLPFGTIAQVFMEAYEWCAENLDRDYLKSINYLDKPS